MESTAFVFPGQGSQFVGMLADWVERYPIILEVFEQASEAIHYDVWRLVQEGPESRLNQTEHTQVAMLTADVTLYQLLLQQGVPKPQWMAGHSLGEYAALVASGALSLSDGVRLVSRRGQLMQETMPLGVGAMAAVIGLTDEQVQLLCEELSQEGQSVAPANYNAIGQIVVAGHSPAVERLVQSAEALGARLAKVIPVSVPCHCPLLAQAADQFSQYLQETAFQFPSVSVISNVDLSVYRSGEDIRDKLKAQLVSPVRWVETIQLLKRQGVEKIVESGPGKVLHGLIKRIDKTLNVFTVSDALSSLCYQPERN